MTGIVKDSAVVGYHGGFLPPNDIRLAPRSGDVVHLGVLVLLLLVPSKMLP